MHAPPIHMISGPRNMSTAIMYAFAQHPDLEVIDEPFYAIYLKHTGKAHPGRDLVLAQMPDNLAAVMQTMLPSDAGKLMFVKDMAHHLGVVADLDWIRAHRVIHLIRHPAKMLASLQKVIPQPTIQDLGLQDQYALYVRLLAMDIPQLVIDSEEILKNPKAGLSRMCAFSGIPFSENMLHWQAGPKPYDGVWAPWWYGGVHKSTGFQPQVTTTTKIAPEHREVYELGLMYYEKMTQNK
jgi:hypothetical protein